MNWINFLFIHQPSRQRIGAKKNYREEEGSKGEKERRKINRAKNTVRRAWLNLREGQMCLQIEVVI